MEIAIAGAGIGGLAAAALLARAGHGVTVFDQYAAPAPVGSGLIIQPVGQAVLDRLGAGTATRARGNRVRRMLGHEATTGRPVLDVWYDRRGDAAAGLAIHRAALFDALHAAAVAAGARIRPGHRVTGVEAGSLLFADGSVTAPFDLVVDASGARSAISPLRARDLPYGAIWGTVDWPAGSPLPEDRLSQCYRRADRMLGVLPIGTLPGGHRRKAAIFWSLPADGHDAWLDGGVGRWRDEACGLWPAFAPFVEQIAEAGQMTMARYAHGTLRRPWGERLAIIGDAAHRASPQLGQGANMALLDAAALAAALGSAALGSAGGGTAGSGTAGVAPALRRYAAARRWHVRVYQVLSWAFTPQYQSDSRILPVLRDRLLYPLSQLPPVPAILSRLVRGDLLPPLAGGLGS
ncbi:MAG: FAD-dependent monooxygenase [Thalassobaculum sp.]|uniref:FAD-dependent oxidoreductase n=1 Tax=Thalassobaculum sp. TaxID=2022740 RepID=UPI0032EC06C4